MELLEETRPPGVDLGAEGGSLKGQGLQAAFPKYALLFCQGVELLCLVGDYYDDSTDFR